AAAIDIPFTVGGGISSVEDVELLLKHGADKVSINSSAVKDPGLIDRLVANFGSQCIVVAMDAKTVGDRWKIHLVGGKLPTEIDPFDRAGQVEDGRAAQILVTSMDLDGRRTGCADD